MGAKNRCLESWICGIGKSEFVNKGEVGLLREIFRNDCIAKLLMVTTT